VLQGVVHDAMVDHRAIASSLVKQAPEAVEPAY
jgi:hypothetical protein